MPLIDNAISFSAYHSKIITEKLQNPAFLHSNWGDEQLQEIRTAIRRFYREKQVGICAYCNNDVSLVSAGNAHIEHIVPKSLRRDFMFHPKNLCVICSDCNQIKRNQEIRNEIEDTLNSNNSRYPRSSGAFKIVHPHFDNYNEHIIKKGRIYIDKTQKGGFTIIACKLNRYFHHFGVEDELVEDDELTELMSNFIDGKSIIQKAKALNKIRDLLFDM